MAWTGQIRHPSAGRNPVLTENFAERHFLLRFWVPAFRPLAGSLSRACRWAGMTKELFARLPCIYIAGLLNECRCLGKAEGMPCGRKRTIQTIP